MILLIDKPKGWTSADVVAVVKKTLHEKTGHGGTLDPNATGLLIIGTGKDTKKLGEITKNTNKTYEAEIILGESRTTDDVEGEVLETQSDSTITVGMTEIKNILKTFEGEQMQMPPQYSAIKIAGKKSYDQARKGIEVKLEPRKITIFSIILVEYNYPVLKIICEVTSGTYIRSLARDIGEKLKTGAYLNELRRTKVGEFLVEKSISPQELTQMPQLKHMQQKRL